MSNIVNQDGVMISRFHYQAHTDKTTVTLEQPTRDLILERNQELRKDDSTLRDLSFGRQVASIPQLDYYALQQKHPGLRSKDAKLRSAELMRVLQLPENKKYLVRSKI